MGEAAIAKARRIRHQEWPMELKAELLTNLFRGNPDLRVMPEKTNAMPAKFFQVGSSDKIKIARSVPRIGELPLIGAARATPILEIPVR